MICRQSVRTLAWTAAFMFAGPAQRGAQAQTSVDLPLGVGLHIPSYDRINGLSLPFGPTVSFGGERLILEPTITYRSHLGVVDPSLRAAWMIKDSVLAFSVVGSRSTFTNDRWIRSDLINSATALLLGDDSRNYFRADRAEGRLTVAVPSEHGRAELYAGTRFENAWSTGWRFGEKRSPYSFAGRNDEQNGIDRPNPLIDRGHIASALAGIGGNLTVGPLTSDIRLRAEAAWHTPLGSKFQQYTLYQEGELHTFGEQLFRFALHGITTTGGGITPRQRYDYIGGSGTLATIDLATLGGDHMYFADMLYIVPIRQVDVPLLGALFVAPRYVVGAANVGNFGVPTTNIGGRVGVGLLRLDYLVDTRTHKREFGFGLSFSR